MFTSDTVVEELRVLSLSFLIWSCRACATRSCCSSVPPRSHKIKDQQTSIAFALHNTMTMALIRLLRKHRKDTNNTKKVEKGRKARSLQLTDNETSETSSIKSKSLGGTYFTTIQRDDNRRLTDSSSSEESWRPSSGQGHHRHSPLVARSGERPSYVNLKTKPTARVHPVDDDIEELGMIMLHSRNLPGTWYFSSNHVLVNKERVKRRIPPLMRRTKLDDLARQHAEAMAANDALYHSDPIELVQSIGRPSRRLGENVSYGTSIRDMHEEMMETCGADKNNILDRRYLTMGMGTAKGPDGGLYMCQIFRG